MSAIVVIDDRPAKRRSLLELAQSVDGVVETEGFADPRSALEASARTPPSLVVIGRTLPTLNGVRAIQRFRKITECEDLPILVIADTEDRRIGYRALEAGASDVLVDPPDPGEFALRARNLIEVFTRSRTQGAKADFLERSLISKERRHKRDMRASRNNLRGVIDTVPAMVSVADREGHYVFMNQYMATFYGKQPEDTVGIPIDELLGASAGERERAANAEVFRGAGTLSGYEEDIVDTTGVARTLLSTKSALRDENRKVVNVVTVSQDITFRKWAEVELRDSKNAAEAANRAKTEFLANVSHELRTPLNAILGFSEGMEQDLLGKASVAGYREYAGHISESARHLVAIIDDVLDIASIEAGRLITQEAEADLSDVVRDAVENVETQAELAGVTVRIGGEPTMPALSTDAARLRQILMNLLSNAIKFSPENGSVGIDLYFGDSGDVQIVVSDSGAGIAAEDMPAATDSFRQIGDLMTNPIGGMGLGLPLSIGLAELLGARIEIDSAEGVGTRVSVIFPEEKLLRRSRRAG